MRNFGFSTGAVALDDFRLALEVVAPFRLTSVELSALRMSEVDDLLCAIPNLDLKQYKHISLHAPSRYEKYEEQELARSLYKHVPKSWRIVLHPDAISDFEIWKRFGPQLAIENMDRRKRLGRTAEELSHVFAKLPQASLCFDIGHARQWDPSLTEAYRILKCFSDRLTEVHLSEVNSESKHDCLSHRAVVSFRQVASLIEEAVPIIIESRVKKEQIADELARANSAMPLMAVDYYSYA